MLTRELRVLLPMMLSALMLLAGQLAAEPVRVLYRARDGAWRELPATTDSQRRTVTFSLDPRDLLGGKTTVIQNPRPGVDLSDAEPPVVLGLKLDGRPLPVRETVDLDWLPSSPNELLVGVVDRRNALDPTAVSVLVNGKALPPADLQVKADGRSARILARIGPMLSRQAMLSNVVTLRVADSAPEANIRTVTLVYRHLARVDSDPQIIVDSCYGGYENASVLVDGKLMEPGVSTVGPTWASREEPGDHWVVLAWPTPRAVNEVEAHWAYYSGGYWTSRVLRLDTWDGRRWVERWHASDNPEAPATVIPVGDRATTRVRLMQPDGGGHPTRGPDILWMDEITVR